MYLTYFGIPSLQSSGRHAAEAQLVFTLILYYEKLAENRKRTLWLNESPVFNSLKGFKIMSHKEKRGVGQKRRASHTAEPAKPGGEPRGPVSRVPTLEIRSTCCQGTGGNDFVNQQELPSQKTPR